MSTIKCKTEDQLLVITDNPIISSGDVDTNNIQFDIDENWTLLSGVTLFAVFYTNSEDAVEVQLTIDGSIAGCSIPFEYTDCPSKFYFGLIAKNSDNTIVKTSAIRGYNIIAGTPNTSTEYVDWLKFKKDLVDTLDNQFDLDLTYSSTVSEILEAISGVENPNDVRAFFIDLLNEQFDLSLNYDDTDEVITQTVTAEATRLFEIEDNYNYLVDGLLRVLGSDSI